MMGSDTFDTLDGLEEDKTDGLIPLGVGPGCTIKNAIIDKNARIGEGVELDATGKPDGYEADGIYVRDGVLIVRKGAVIASGTKV